MNIKTLSNLIESFLKFAEKLNENDRFNRALLPFSENEDEDGPINETGSKKNISYKPARSLFDLGNGEYKWTNLDTGMYFLNDDIDPTYVVSEDVLEGIERSDWGNWMREWLFNNGFTKGIRIPSKP